MIFNSPERIAALTPLYQDERSADGRPRVPDDILERMRLVTNDEAWGVVERGHDYHFQFEGNWVNLHPDRVLVGRAMTSSSISSARSRMAPSSATTWGPPSRLAPEPGSSSTAAFAIWNGSTNSPISTSSAE